jgi:hypothetical protein
MQNQNYSDKALDRAVENLKKHSVEIGIMQKIIGRMLHKLEQDLCCKIEVSGMPFKIKKKPR